MVAGSREQVRERRAHGAERTGDRDVRIIESPRGADIGVRRNEVLLGLQDVRPALQQRRGQVGRYLGRDQLVEGLAARDRSRVAPEQDRDQVLLRCDGLFEGRNGGQRLLLLRCDLHHVGLRDDAGLESQVEDPRRFAEVAGRRLRDLELAVECAQRDVAGRDARHQRQHHAALRLLAGVDLRLRRFAQAPHAPEQVELPGCAERRLVKRKVVVDTAGNRRLADAARPHPTGIRAVADLRIQLRARGFQCADELIDPRGGDAHVEVLAQCGIHQLVERRIAELLPPLRVGHIGGLRVVDAPRRRCIHDRGARSRDRACSR